MYILMIGCDEYLWRCGGIPSTRCHFFAYFSLLSKPLFYFNGRFGALNLAVHSPRQLKEIWPVRIEWRHWLVAAMSGSGVIDHQSLLARFKKMRNLEEKI